MLREIKEIKHKIKLYIYIAINFLESLFSWKPTIMSMMETLDYIIENKVSISRFGDGEFRWMLDIPQDNFQEQSDELKNELLNVYHFEDEHLLLCVPPYWGGVKEI